MFSSPLQTAVLKGFKEIDSGPKLMQSKKILASVFWFLFLVECGLCFLFSVIPFLSIFGLIFKKNCPIGEVFGPWSIQGWSNQYQCLGY